MKIPIAAIKADRRNQPRVQVDPLVVDDYADAMRSGREFPPVVVFKDGQDYWLADGFHRYQAAQEIGEETIAADVHDGTFRDAALYAVGANTSHGKPRTNADKRRAVLILLDDAEWSQWSDSEIGRRAGVSNRFVGNLRAEASLKNSKIETERRVERGGKPYTMNTARIGSRKKIVKEARELIRETDLADDPRQLSRLAGKPAEVQVRAAQMIADGEAKRVDVALRQIAYEGKVGRSLEDVPSGRFPVIYADPPWRYESGDGLRGSEADQYPTLSTEEICPSPWPRGAPLPACVFSGARTPICPMRFASSRPGASDTSGTLPG